ncbi:NAD(P)-dependent dehydrogenase (short-subunit alcohol dehydrogenase family) [Crossiella equi]|uniref:NAD(P)-dependent dehydrogenase (Short-subunit alcohol dehydrogenase family) n=1 Tax=Crossiella equi TaxID=130796 RepID=A0ABS5A6I0_9PSEU|nr:SDR family oxidoreductase [Crossiella equi]MBP2472200.1 NAD(P)-dependent dehydrogenase (short-subunit alcohol dehydrogenase family) [Crossiella equi]
MDMNGCTALVTGGTAGIGRATAHALAARGAHVLVSGRDTERGAAVAAAVGADGGRAEFLAADLADLDSVRALADQAGEVDVLVNNAAIFPMAPTADHPADLYQLIFDVNVRAPFFLASALLPGMLARGRGTIVNVGSVAAVSGVPGFAAYSASKAALEALTRAWVAEFQGTPIRVNTVAPGPTATETMVAFGPEAVELARQDIPLGRIATPEDVADAVVFLASPAAAHLHGVRLPVDGGRAAV